MSRRKIILQDIEVNETSNLKSLSDSLIEQLNDLMIKTSVLELYALDQINKSELSTLLKMLKSVDKENNIIAVHTINNLLSKL